MTIVCRLRRNNGTLDRTEPNSKSRRLGHMWYDYFWFVIQLLIRICSFRFDILLFCYKSWCYFIAFVEPRFYLCYQQLHIRFLFLQNSGHNILNAIKIGKFLLKMLVLLIIYVLSKCEIYINHFIFFLWNNFNLIYLSTISYYLL